MQGTRYSYNPSSCLASTTKSKLFPRPSLRIVHAIWPQMRAPNSQVRNGVWGVNLFCSCQLASPVASSSVLRRGKHFTHDVWQNSHFILHTKKKQEIQSSCLTSKRFRLPSVKHFGFQQQFSHNVWARRRLPSPSGKHFGFPAIITPTSLAGLGLLYLSISPDK